MLKKYEQVAYELLRPAQVKERRSKASIAYIPAGALEWHSFHSPLGTDGLKAHAVCCEAALQYGGVVLPPFYQGLHGMHNWGPKGWQGYTLGYTVEKTFESIMVGICRALIAGGWRVIVGVTGHDVAPQRDALSRAIRKATKGSRVRGFALMEGELQRSHRTLPLSMDHAAAWETSCIQYACPGAVDLAALRKRKLSASEDLDIRGPEGIGGKNPVKYASAKLGRKIVETLGHQIGRKARSMLRRR